MEVFFCARKGKSNCGILKILIYDKYRRSSPMKRMNKEKFQSRKNKFLLGSSAAIVTNLALIVGLLSSPSAKISIIGSILIFAVADNISETLGIHMYQEAEGLKTKDVWLSSFTNFISRFLFSLLFILIILVLPLEAAAVCCVIIGLSTISLISYFIAVHKKTRPINAISEHVGVAVLTIVLSRIVGNIITNQLHH